MPPNGKRPRKNNGKNKNKTKGKGRKSYYKSRTSINKSLMPDRKYCSLVWTSALIDQSPTTIINWTQIIGGGMFDPLNLGGSPHQPMGFDQLANFYSRYRVNAVKIMIEGSVMTTGQTVCLLTGFSDDVSLPASLTQSKEQKSYQCKLLNSERPFKYTRYIPLNVIHARTKQQYQMEDNYVGVLQSSGGTNPADSAYINVGLINLDETTSTRIIYRLTIIFYACVSELRTLPLS